MNFNFKISVSGCLLILSGCASKHHELPELPELENQYEEILISDNDIDYNIFKQDSVKSNAEIKIESGVWHTLKADTVDQKRSEMVKWTPVSDPTVTILEKNRMQLNPEFIGSLDSMILKESAKVKGEHIKLYRSDSSEIPTGSLFHANSKKKLVNIPDEIEIEFPQYDENNLLNINEFGIKNKLSSMEIKSIHFDRNDNMWIGTINNEVMKFNGSKLIGYSVQPDPTFPL
jgi:hypothetical protein